MCCNLCVFSLIYEIVSFDMIGFTDHRSTMHDRTYISKDILEDYLQVI